MLPVEVVEQGLYYFGLTKGINYLNKIYGVYQYRRFCDLATYLGASKRALSIRLKYLGYLKYDEFDIPYHDYYFNKMNRRGKENGNFENRNENNETMSELQLAYS